MVGCEICSASEKLFQCARCRRAFYCSKEHQRQHWKAHKVHCKVLDDQQKSKHFPENNPLSSPSTSNAESSSIREDHRQLVEQFAEQLSATDVSTALSLAADARRDDSHWHQNHQVVLPSNNEDDDDHVQLQDASLKTDAAMGLEDRPCAAAAIDKVLSTAANNSASKRTNVDNVQRKGIAEAALTPLYPPPYLHRNARMGVSGDGEQVNSPGWVQTMSQYVVRDLDSHGICVIDNFVGNHLGAAILSEVLDMYESGQFVDGKLMSNSSENISRVIRGDKIHWVTGQEAHCKSIGHLVRLVDSVVLNSNRMANNGKLGQYTITDRTKAMVACYPGGGAAYVKHVDNPNKDGRCVTSIYYLNKNWDVKKDGGLLRIFPRDWPQVADIEPVFDRILFFWSDRRNPHEVQPALRTRYAITLWYQDKLERELAALTHSVH